MIGWSQVIDYTRTASGRTHPYIGAIPQGHVIGIVVAAKFPEPELIREKLEEGLARVAPDTVWVMRNPRKRGDAISVAWDVLEEHGVEPVLAPTNTEYWGTNARGWRDRELALTVERLIVFHDISSNITASFLPGEHSHRKVFVIERGKKKAAPRRKGRKPQGV